MHTPRGLSKITYKFLKLSRTLSRRHLVDPPLSLSSLSLFSLSSLSSLSPLSISRFILSLGLLSKGVRELAVTLRHNASLTSLNLWNNKMGPEGAALFADALVDNTTLQAIGEGEIERASEGDGKIDKKDR